MHKPSKILLLYLENHWADRAQIWYARRDSPAKRFAIVKSGCLRTYARATCTNTPEIPLLYLDNHSADGAQMWYVRIDQSTKGCSLAKSVMHPHVRTCHVHNLSKCHCYISTATSPIALKFGTHIGTHQLTGLHWSKVGCIRTCARATCTTPQNIIAISRQPLDRSCSNLVRTLRFTS